MYELLAFVFLNSFLLRGIILFIFGLIIGSFLNVVIYRLPIMLQRKWRRECVEFLGEEGEPPPTQQNADKEVFNLLLPYSHCPHCKKKVPFWANIPLLGYILVLGKCHYCAFKISWRYPFIEALTGACFVIAGYFYNDSYALSCCLVFVALTIAIMFIDYDTRIIPDELVYLLLWLGLLANLNGQFAGSLSSAVIGAVLGYLALWGIFWLFKLLTKKEGLGYGDFKLLAALLAFCGYQAITPIILMASLLGILYFSVGKLLGKFSYDHQIPLGTFLGIAGIAMLLFNKYLYIFALN